MAYFTAVTGCGGALMFVANSDCIEFMRTLPDNSVDSIVTDPPYGLSKAPNMAEVMRHWLNGDDYQHKGAGFMGKSWDSFVPGPSVWREALRVLKPGGHLAAFAGSRTYDLMCLSIRLADFEIRDQLMWLYGSGFPKSLDVSKAIDAALGVRREAVARSTDRRGDGTTYGLGLSGNLTSNKAVTAAAAWQGWGTALKPAHEPIVLARKPLDGTVANNIMVHGAGALNIDGCRVGDDVMQRTKSSGVKVSENGSMSGGNYSRVAAGEAKGRGPGNVLHDGCLPEPMDRYYYCAKANKADREAGLQAFGVASAGAVTGGRAEGSDGLNSPRAGAGRKGGGKNIHPTVKPTDLMRWLVRLITPSGGVVLDPFTGSGSTGRAAMLEGVGFVGSEMDADYCRIAEARILDALLTASANKS